MIAMCYETTVYSNKMSTALIIIALSINYQLIINQFIKKSMYTYNLNYITIYDLLLILLAILDK